MSTDPNSHSFSSSSVMTYSKLGDEPPKLFHASAQTRTGPGGVSCASLEMNLQTFKWENKFKILFTAM